MPNRLAHETSPYLLQHAENPVDWYPWGDEALERARHENKPILLSIGYAACHWCHVMAHESFENPTIAALMNDRFVNIKVDREERPDLDSIYMQAVQAMTGHGGWPMTVFLTPQGEPFFGGTYYPPADRHGMPGFPRVLEALADAYSTQPDAIMSTTAQLREIYGAASRVAHASGPVNATVLQRAFREIARSYDPVHGGFGGAPKFPPSMVLEFLLTHWSRSGEATALDIVRQSFLAMARGGIYDQLGGGIHRYSVDERWLVPHFEKMLYDNALFLRLGVHLWQATGDNDIRRVCTDTVAWLAREMTAPEGGFYSSLDADSEGHEGTFYVWSSDEFDQLLGADSALARAAWGVTAGGNFEGKNILHQARGTAEVAAQFGLPAEEVGARLEQARVHLHLTRSNRVWPARDDKVLASWNGLMLRALAEYARVFEDETASALAVRNGRFLRAELVRDGAVLRSWRQGKVLAVGFLEDQAAVALAFLELYTLTADVEWLQAARDIATQAVDRFLDPQLGLLFDTPADHEPLVTRPRDFTDNALPSGTSLKAELLHRLGIIDDRKDWVELSARIVGQIGEGLVRHAQAFGHLSCVADMVVHGMVEVVVVGARGHPVRRELERSIDRTFVPSSITLRVADGEADETALGRGRRAVGGIPMAYVCRRYVCDAPTSDPELLMVQLRQALKPLGNNTV
jgi:uncharacterized protein YyaL (SSP411 family)